MGQVGRVGQVGLVGRVSWVGHPLAACAAIVALAAVAAAPSGREVCVTFDDLPIGGVVPHDAASSRAITAKLLQAITAHHIPAVGFVNESKLGGGENSDPRTDRVDLLRMWLDAGLELGNHTYSHEDLNRTALPDFEKDVLRGEAVTRPLLAHRGMTLRFFRHPFLHTGRDLETKRAFESFLASHGYRIAPVTIDNDEYIFAAAYDRASERGDHALMRRVADAYVPYMDAKFEFFERNSRDLFGYEMRQILLVHANALNADRFGDLADAIERRGYRFITLDRALEDQAYRSADTFTGPGGITWLHRWAITKGVGKDFFAGEPNAPDFVIKAATPR
jgi:peptidoglycan/xylan/chitin deacetylase (PgdA/CDA1 family)